MDDFAKLSIEAKKLEKDKQVVQDNKYVDQLKRKKEEIVKQI